MHKSPAPLYRDPIYDGAADPVAVYNREKKNGGGFTPNVGPIYNLLMLLFVMVPIFVWQPLQIPGKHGFTK